MSKIRIKDKEVKDMMALIKVNIQRDDFRKYLDLCVKKWDRLRVELEIIDAIMASICKHWNISKQELIEDKHCIEPRYLMYYIIKKELAGLSYGEIGEMFGRPKSYVHKAVDDMAFFVEQNGKKSLAQAFMCIQNELRGKSNGGVVSKVGFS